MEDLQIQELTKVRKQLFQVREALKSCTIENQEELMEDYDALVKYHNSMLENMHKFMPFYSELDVRNINSIVCDYFNIDKEVFLCKTRKREIVQARYIAMYLSKHYTSSSLARIGEQTGRKDHATVLHAIKTVNNLCETDKVFRHWVAEIESLIKKKAS